MKEYGDSMGYFDESDEERQQASEERQMMEEDALANTIKETIEDVLYG